MGLPGQFPGEELYNIDIWEESFWVKKVLAKEAIRDLHFLQYSRLGMWGSEEFKKKEMQLINKINILEPPPRRVAENEHAASWNFLKSGKRAKKRG